MKRHVVVYLLWRQDVQYWRNATFYQRMRALATHFRLVLLGRHGVRVCHDLADQLVIQQCPIPRFTGGRLAILGEVLYLGWLVFAVLWYSRLQPSRCLVYTFQGLEATPAAVLAFLGYRWVADIVDLPEEQFLTVRPRGLRGWLGYLIRRAHLWVIRRSLHRAALVSTIGWSEQSGLAPYLLQRYQVPQDRLISLPNGVDARIIEEGVGRPRELGRFRVFYVGSVVPRLGANVVLRAVALARRRIPELTLTLAGPVPRFYAQEFESLVRKLGLNDIITVHGKLDSPRVLAEIRDTDVCLYPFLQGEGVDETIPIKVFEYLALGRPLIASDLAGVRPLLVDGENALLVPPGDETALADALVRLYKDVALWERLSLSGPKVARNFDWPRLNEPLITRVAELTMGSR
jgi:glycosyltransferase involved in cell wall biosynthesis